MQELLATLKGNSDPRVELSRDGVGSASDPPSTLQGSGHHPTPGLDSAQMTPSVARDVAPRESPRPSSPRVPLSLQISVTPVWDRCGTWQRPPQLSRGCFIAAVTPYIPFHGRMEGAIFSCHLAIQIRKQLAEVDVVMV